LSNLPVQRAAAHAGETVVVPGLQRLRSYP
jgi:hypothetical protein